MTTINTRASVVARGLRHRDFSRQAGTSVKAPALLSALCVEDDDDTRVMLGIYLKSLGLDVSLAATADEALRWSETNDFDLYLLDAWLPDLDGYELCRQVRRRARRANRILFFSGAAYELDRQKGIEAGANAYVFKPNVDELIDTLSTLIAEAGTVETEASTCRGDFPD